MSSSFYIFPTFITNIVVFILKLKDKKTASTAIE